MQDAALPARGSACDPKQWEKFSQNFVLTEDLVSCAAPATLALLLLFLLIVLLLLSCTEIPGNKHIRILLLPHLVLPTKNVYLFLRGTHELSKQRGRNHLKLSEWGKASWMGRSLGKVWEQGGSKGAQAGGFELKQETLGEKYK